jgi:outer membrane protein assembly factor BamB
MKIQCACGAKYAFDLTPEMLHNPVRFVCPACGLDSSEYVNQLVREQFAEPATDAPAAPPPAATPARLRIAHEEKPAEAPTAAAPVSKFCPKHRGVLATEHCTVCQQPICPKCMELFGFFCSPHCKNKADMQGIAAPVYAGEKSRTEARFWRKTGLIFGIVVVLLVLFVGALVWYAWFGSVPHSYFSVRFADDDRAYFGATHLVGQHQIIFLHGGTLARYDLKSKKQIWSQELITKQQLADAVKAGNEADARANSGGGYTHRQSQETIEREAKIGLQRELQLRVSGQNIWVSQGDKLVQYNWDTGKMAHAITLPEFGGELVTNGDELLMVGAQSVTHVSVATGDSRVEQVGVKGSTALAANGDAGNSGGGGLLSANGKPLDPDQVAAQAQNLNLQGRIALPALIANASYEQQLEAALNDDEQHPRPKKAAMSMVGMEGFQLVPSQAGIVQFSAKLLEERRITRSAMKAAPKKAALDGDVNAAHTGEIVNEQLNEMQRNAGGGTVTEDASRYQVTVHLPDASGTPDWTGEVVGSPQFIPLKTVNLIAAGKTVIVLDKANKKLWQTTLTYSLPEGGSELFSEKSKFGEGPCVEHDGTLYVFDQAVLSAYDVTTGNARWRLPSVGVVGLFFDDQGMIYVNTTTGNPDDIKYARQIDIEKRTDDVLMKVDAKTGKTIWSVKPGGFISYLSGKYLYTVQAYDPNPTDEEQMSDMALTKPPYFRIARLDPKNGRILWEYYQDRVPFDVRFHDNIIELVFKREVEVLKYLAL